MSRKCEYAKKCKLYSETSVTCNYEPGEYCGAFREHKANATQLKHRMSDCMSYEEVVKGLTMEAWKGTALILLFVAIVGVLEWIL